MFQCISSTFPILVLQYQCLNVTFFLNLYSLARISGCPMTQAKLWLQIITLVLNTKTVGSWLHLSVFSTNTFTGFYVFIISRPHITQINVKQIFVSFGCLYRVSKHTAWAGLTWVDFTSKTRTHLSLILCGHWVIKDHFSCNANSLWFEKSWWDEVQYAITLNLSTQGRGALTRGTEQYSSEYGSMQSWRWCVPGLCQCWYAQEQACPNLFHWGPHIEETLHIVKCSYKLTTA